jgi:23S rRNA (cytosine1962-C5)-methyltransferase
LSTSSKSNVPRLRLRVTATAEQVLRGGHPWLFAGSIHEQNREGTAGEMAVIYDRKDKFLAIGLYDPDSPLRVRVLHRGKPLTIDDGWWRRQFDAAVSQRRDLFDERTTGYRLIYGESDGWPGLVLDRYAGVLVLKLYTLAWLPRLAELVALIREGTSDCKQIVLRLSRNIQEQTQRDFNVRDGQVIFGPPVEQTPVFLETGIQFESDVLRGQKTGFFLDQRENRRRVESLARGAEVLNAFSFSGGFSLYAARGGAKSVTDLDISAHALEAANRNFVLNASDAAISSCRHESVQADVFDWLDKNQSRKFDLIIIDPPSLAKRESERAGAINAYAKLAVSGVRMLRPGGVLVAASCSAHVSPEEFFDAVRASVRKSGRSYAELGTTGHPPDHPAAFREAQYLKCIYLKLNQ